MSQSHYVASVTHILALNPLAMIIFYMPMKHPPHPGQILREDCLPELGLTIGGAATALGAVGRPSTRSSTGAAA